MKALLAKITDFFLYSNVYIAICGVCVYMQGMLLSGYSLQWDLLPVFVFFSTLFTYILIRVAAKKRISAYNRSPRWEFFFRHYPLMRFLLFLSMSVCAVLYFTFSRTVELLLLVPGCIALLYGVPLFRRRGKLFRIRDAGISKIFQISFVWAFIGSFLPVAHAGGAIFSAQTWLLFAAEFFFIFAIDLPFDIRDMEIDVQNAVRTIPVIMGVEFTRNLAVSCLFFCACLHTWLQRGFHPGPVDFTGALAISILLSGLLVVQITGKRRESMYLGLVDGTMILQFLLVWAASRIM